jgi:hypothetical protein
VIRRRRCSPPRCRRRATRPHLSEGEEAAASGGGTGPVQTPHSLASARCVTPYRSSRPPSPGALHAPRGPSRAVVRYERKGRGGKEATVVEQLALSAR